MAKGVQEAVEERKVNSKTEGNRMVHIDLLRILACFSVVMLHCAAQFWYTLPVTDTNWKIANSYDAVFRFGVPVFVMISGALFLPAEKETNLKRLYTHNILRLVIIYIVWSCIYGLFDCRFYPWSVLDKGDIIREIFAGRYHLWYLPMIVGIYMLLPILRSWINSAEKKNLQYFLLLFLIFQVGKETLLVLRQTEGMRYLWGLVSLDMVCGYLGYFVLGYYIVHYGIAQKWHKWIYLGGVLSAGANIVLGDYLAQQAGAPVGEIYDSFGFFTFLIVVSIFLFFTQKMSKINYPAKLRGLIKELSLATLGIYLLHIGLIEFLEPFGIHSMMFAPAVCIPVFAVFCFAACFVLAALLRRIPLVGKYIC